jgi:hypothetical protein
LPEARGQGLGLKVLERLISKLGLGCRIAVMKSFPLQLEIEGSSKPDEFEQRMALDAMPGGRHRGTQKVGAILPLCWIPVGQRYRSPHD